MPNVDLTKAEAFPVETVMACGDKITPEALTLAEEMRQFFITDRFQAIGRPIVTLAAALFCQNALMPGRKQDAETFWRAVLATATDILQEMVDHPRPARDALHQTELTLTVLAAQSLVQAAVVRAREEAAAQAPAGEA